MINLAEIIEPPPIIAPTTLSPTRGIMIVELSTCHLCKKRMIRPPSRQGPFPIYINESFYAQCKQAGWEIISSIKVDDHAICKSCADAGMATFECYVCEQRKPTNKIKESIGDSPDFMCTDCYESVPAKKWIEAEESLREVHKYDYM